MATVHKGTTQGDNAIAIAFFLTKSHVDINSTFGQDHLFGHSPKILVVSHFHDFTTQHQCYFKNTYSC